MVPDYFVYFCLAITVLITIFGIETRSKRIERKINLIENYLDLILNRMEIEVPSKLSERVKQIALDPQRKIEAIKLYREETKVSLREAKEAIETFISLKE